MQSTSSWLDGVTVASPCSASWDDMAGDERVRFCSHCSLHVYNLSAMTHADAEALVHDTEGRLCARVFRRADGTLLTKDCPRSRIRKQVRRAWALVAATWLAALGIVFGASDRRPSHEAKTAGATPDWRPAPTRYVMGQARIGKVIPLPVAPKPKPIPPPVVPDRRGSP